MTADVSSTIAISPAVPVHHTRSVLHRSGRPNGISGQLSFEYVSPRYAFCLHAATLFPAQLSDGQQQVVGVARAIIGSPKLLLADEPTGNLHTEQSEQIMEIFKKLNGEGVTIIQVTHSEKMASYGNRIVNLKDGVLVEGNPYGEKSIDQL